MPVEGLHPVLELTLNSLIAGNTELTSWKMLSKFGTHTLTLHWKDSHDSSNLDRSGNSYTAYRKKPPSQLKRDRERKNGRKDSKSDSGLAAETNGDKMSISSIDYNYANEYSLMGGHDACSIAHVSSTPGPWTAVHAPVMDSEPITCINQPSVQCQQKENVNNTCDQTLKVPATSLHSSIYLDCSKPVNFASMGNLSSEFEMLETVQQLESPSQQTCNTVLCSDPFGHNLVETTDPVTIYEDLAKEYWIPAPDEDPDLLLTCMNCNLNIEKERTYYECEECFNYYCEGCYLGGVHRKHYDKLSLNLNLDLNWNLSISNSDFESDDSSCSTLDDDSGIIQFGLI